MKPPPPTYRPTHLRLGQVPAYIAKHWGVERTRQEIYAWTDYRYGLKGKHLHTSEQARPGCRTTIRVVSIADLFAWIMHNHLAKHHLDYSEGSNSHV
jgi:hypothetical protein